MTMAASSRAVFFVFAILPAPRYHAQRDTVQPGKGDERFKRANNCRMRVPDECIDCGVCEPECPVDAIKPDTEPGLEKWLSINTEYAKLWPNITLKKEPPADAKEWEGVPDKEQYFSPNPGDGT